MRESPPHTCSWTAESNCEQRNTVPPTSEEPVVQQPQASSTIATRLAVPSGSEYSKEMTSSRARRNPAKPTTAKKQQKSKKGIRKPDTLPQALITSTSGERPSDSRSQQAQGGTASQSRSRDDPFPKPFEHISRDGWRPPTVEIILPHKELSSLTEDSPSHQAPIGAKDKGKTREVPIASNRSWLDRTRSSMIESAKSFKREDLPASFRKIIADEVRSQIGSIRSERSESHSQHHQSQIGTSKYRNTVQGAMDVLFRSRDADETSSAYNQRVRAQMRPQK
jgi:hypothetical protein